MRDIELEQPCHGASRATAPLFADDAGHPYRHERLDDLLNDALLFLFGAVVVHFNSAVYHCYAAHSEATAARLLRCDLAGIGFFILVCMVNGVVHAFRCTPA